VRFSFARVESFKLWHNFYAFPRTPRQKCW